MSPAGIEPANFRFVAQHLNHCATAVPIIYLFIHLCMCNWRNGGIRNSDNIALSDGIVVNGLEGMWKEAFDA